MKNIFAKFQDYVKKPNRNTFDLSFYNNLTLKFGQLTPVFCKEVIPGDSFRINTAFGLQLMPMKFPVQTPMRAYVHYFYVRNRTLWKDWMDFIGGTKDGLTPPYVTPVDKEKFFRVGGLADYLGVPNVVYGNFSTVLDVTSESDPITDGDALVEFSPYSWSESSEGNAYLGKWGIFNFDYPLVVNSRKFISPSVAPFKPYNWTAANVWNPSDITANLANVLDVVQSSSDFVSTLGEDNSNFAPLQVIAEWDSPFRNTSISFEITYHWNEFQSLGLGTRRGLNWVTQGNAVPFYLIVLGQASSACYMINTYEFQHNDLTEGDYGHEDIWTFSVSEELLEVLGENSKFILCVPAHTEIAFNSNTTDPQEVLANMYTDEFIVKITKVEKGGSVVIGSENIPTTPYDSDIHLNALPFRAYEAIYNAYYRNPQNNPFILSGVPEYNRYNTTYDGGADSTEYDLYFRNWEYDFLTSAVQSPQQGTAPLVGISVTGEATFQDEDGNTYYAQAILNDEGEITGWQSHSSNMPTGSLRLLMDMAGSGISINDLRNVNAFQRFLENNIRRGLKYREQLMSHFGVKARYDELDMPEFIGGCSTSINVNKLSQTSESGDTPLGSFVGQASAFGQSKHSITHYCDEHGFIIGIMSVVPVPVYSQLLPKFFVKSQQLDYYFPEFGHIGYQPIQQKEVSPLQTFYDGSDLNKVFGYNRAWYDYLASTDEVHSQFRTTMRDFLMNRTFDSEPELSEAFLLVDPDQLNDVFLAGTDDNDLYAPESDKIIGSIYFDVSAKRPIPLFGIPKLTD